MTALRLLVMAFVLTAVGCDRKSEVPKDLDKPLPPPPVAGGGGGGEKAGNKPSLPASKAD